MLHGKLESIHHGVGEIDFQAMAVEGQLAITRRQLGNVNRVDEGFDVDGLQVGRQPWPGRVPASRRPQTTDHRQQANTRLMPERNVC